MKNSLSSFCFLIFSLVFFKASSNLPSPFLPLQSVYKSNVSVNVIYQNNTLLIKGIHVNGNLKIYSIIGNLIIDMYIQDFTKVVIPISLERQNLYIIRIETTDNRIFTHKIVAHWLGAVIRGFFGNADIVWMTFFDTGGCDGNKLSFILKGLNVFCATIAHPRL